MIFDTSATTFEKDVLQRSNVTPVVVLFWAEWCGPCKSFKPLLKRVADELHFDVAMVDAGTESAIALRYTVRSVPALKVFNKGRVVAEVTGPQDESSLRSFVAKAGVSTSTLSFE